MSLIRPILNGYLRRFEKRRLAKSTDVADIRAHFERSAGLFFHAPRGMQQHPLPLGAAADALELRPERLRSDLVVFYFHGGGFLFSRPESYAAMLGCLAFRLGARAVLPRYRLAPEHPCPCAIDDVVNAYLGLIETGVPACNIVIGGDSAGETLAFNLLARIKEQDWPKPRGVFSFSPFTDFAQQSPSFRENADLDAILPAERAAEMLEMYLDGADPHDPAISPILGDYRGAPPVWLCASDNEILRDDARRLCRRLLDLGVTCHLEEAHDLPHVWPIFHNILPEARKTLDDVAVWINALPLRADES